MSGPNIDWVNETWNQVLSLLGETPPDGKQFSSAVEHLMNREEAWNGWKNEGCPGALYLLVLHIKKYQYMYFF